MWVQLFPLVSRKPIDSARVAVTKQQTSLDLRERYEVFPGAPAALALSRALQSPNEYESSLGFTLRGVDADGQVSHDLAEGLLSLRELWSSGSDVVRATVPLVSPEDVTLAELIVSVSAIEVFKNLTAPPKPKRVERLEGGPATEQASDGARTLGFSAKETTRIAPPRSSAEVAMEQARAEREDLASSIAQQLSVVPPPHGTSVIDRSERAMLWQASQRLDRSLELQSKPAVQEENWAADTTHNILFQFVSFAPEATAPLCESIYLSFQMYHCEPRTTPRALLQRSSDAASAASHAAAKSEGEVVIRVGELRLAPELQEGATTTPMWVQVQLPAGLAPEVDLAALRTEALARRGGGKVAFAYRRAVPLQASGRAASQIGQLLNSTDESALAVRFTLMTSPRARSAAGPTELGSGSVSLLSLLRNGADVENFALRLSSTIGHVGTLSVSVAALQALSNVQRFLDTRAAAGAQAAPAGSAAAFLAQHDADEAATGSGRETAGEFMLVAADPALAREGPGLVERFLLQPPAEGRVGHADWDAHAEQQAKRFKSYLREKSVYVDVWDGTSLLQIGTARVPLAALLRKGTEQVGNAAVCKEYIAVDVLATQLTSIDAAPSADAVATAAPVLRGRLKLVLARLSAAANKASGSGAGGSRTSGRASGRNAKVAPAELSASTGLLLESGSEQHKVRIRALSTSSNINRAREPTAADEASLYQRQLRRQKQREWLRTSGATLAGGPAADGVATAKAGALGAVARALEMGLDEQQSLARARLQLQQRELRAAEAARLSNRDARLRSLLQDSTQQVRYMYPHYGSAEFIEIPFRNPYGAEHCFTIKWDDPLAHTSIVTSVQEWRALKALHDVQTPAEEKLVLQGQQLWLMPQEMVYIPIKYQAWQHGHVSANEDAPEGPSAQQLLQSGARAVAAAPIVRRSILLTICNVKQEEVACVELRIRPQPFVLDQTFRFHQSENEFLKTTIRLQSVRWHSSGPLMHALGVSPATIGPPPAPLPFSAAPTSIGSSAAPQPVWVRTSDPDVVAGVHEQRGPSDPVEVSIKYKCAASPSVNRFLVLVYKDVWMHELLETWEVIVHALQRIDLHALVGQTSTAKALLRGDSHSAHVSHMPQRLAPSAPRLPIMHPPTAPPHALELVQRADGSSHSCVGSRAVLRVRARRTLPHPECTIRARPWHSQRRQPSAPAAVCWAQAVRGACGRPLPPRVALIVACVCCQSATRRYKGLLPLRARILWRQQEDLARQPVHVRRDLPLLHGPTTPPKFQAVGATHCCGRESVHRP